MKKYLTPNTVCLGLLLVFGVASCIPKGEVDTPDTKSLTVQVQSDLAGDRDKAQQFAGLYGAAAYLAENTDLEPQDLFKRVATAKTILKLSDPELSKTVQDHLKPYEAVKEWDAETRAAFIKDVKALSEACKEVK